MITSGSLIENKSIINSDTIVIEVGTPGPQGPRGLSGLTLNLQVDEFNHGDSLVPSKVPIGNVLKYLNGILLRTTDTLVTEPQDSVIFVYQTNM